MRIAVVSNTVLPACEPDDPLHTSYYGSESYVSMLVRGLASAGHKIGYWAPASSTTFHGNPSIYFHPIINSKGKHLQSELLEDISYDGSKTEDLTEFDFVLDMSKQNHISEELSLYHGFDKFICYKSGFNDWHTPMRIEKKHFVTHCNTFAAYFRQNGYEDVNVARFGIPEFWCPGEDEYFDSFGLKKYEYFLYPHRAHDYKGFDIFKRLAVIFPNEKFVVSTSGVFADHFQEIARAKTECANIPNIVFIDCPHNHKYHYFRRSIMRHASAVLSLFVNSPTYFDTGGLISFESLRAGTSVIVTRSPGSTEMLGELEDKGVVFVDGFDGARLAIKYKAWETRPTVGSEWMPVSTFVNDYIEIMKKYNQ